MNHYTSEHREIQSLVASLSMGNPNSRPKEYVTIDGVRGFKMACPMCSPCSVSKNAMVFPKRVENWDGDYPFQWFYLCKGKKSCSCSGMHSLEYFVRKYTNSFNKYD